MSKTTLKVLLKEDIIKNLLLVMSKAADKGDVKGTIKLAKFLQKKINCIDDVVIQSFSKDGEQSNDTPPNE